MRRSRRRRYGKSFRTRTRSRRRSKRRKSSRYITVSRGGIRL